MLAPAVMISACGLLLLSINNKHSSITNRIRLLNEEKRRFLFKMKDEKDLELFETIRYQSIGKQLDDMLYRLKLVRNVIIFFVSGIFLFILTSLIIGLEMFLKINEMEYLKVICFILGMISVAIGMIYSLTETLKGYKIVFLDVKADE
ncbi:MAG: DUF2721 domain-containing protein [Ignavibacteria bacterium]|nr:DUF2721 domain-containing protein [Ignavibacteria bacterium]